MIDRSANLRAIITGRGNSAGFTAGARACHKKLSHARMRRAGRAQIAKQLVEMDEAALDAAYRRGLYELCILSSDSDQFAFYEELVREQDNKEKKHQEHLAARRARYKQRKIVSQVERYEELVAQLKKLDDKLVPEARHQLSAKRLLLVF